MLFLSFILSFSFASNIIIQAPTADTNEFFIYSHQSEGTSISNYFMECQNKDIITQLIKKAQFHFLNSDISKAQAEFTKIKDQKWNCEWQKEERQAIVYALFRLAQLSNQPSQRMRFLTEAINFDDTILPNKTLIPPPTVQLYNKIKKTLKKKAFLVPSFFKNYSHILRNGVTLDISGGHLNVYPLKARFALVSDKYLAEQLISEPSRLERQSLIPKPLVMGSCGNYRLTDELMTIKKNMDVYFSKDCKIQPTQATAQNKDQGPSLNTSPHLPQQKFSSELTSNHFPSEKKKSWLRRNYLWVGAATVLISGLIANELSKKKETDPIIVPSNTYSSENR